MDFPRPILGLIGGSTLFTFTVETPPVLTISLSFTVTIVTVWLSTRWIARQHREEIEDTFARKLREMKRDSRQFIDSVKSK